MPEYEFGLVPTRCNVTFRGGAILQVPAAHEHIDEFKDRAHPDGHVYPPIIETRSQKGLESWELVPNSRRGALVQALPVTHRLIIDEEHGSGQDLRLGVAGMLMHLVGALHGVRVQFDEWYVDGRVSTRRESDHYPPSEERIGDACTAALSAWRTWQEHPQRLVVNALYLHGRASSIEFLWERFVNQYLVADAAFKLVSLTQPRWHAPRRHADRLKALCELFGIPTDGSPLEDIVRVRNDLFHEAMWAGGMPGMTDSQDQWNAWLALHGLCLRLIYGAIGLRGRYLASSWWSRQTHFYDLAPAV